MKYYFIRTNGNFEIWGFDNNNNGWVYENDDIYDVTDAARKEIEKGESEKNEDQIFEEHCLAFLKSIEDWTSWKLFEYDENDSDCPAKQMENELFYDPNIKILAEYENDE